MSTVAFRDVQPAEARHPDRREAGPAAWGRRLVRGRPEDPAWVRASLLVLLAGTGVLYLWGLGASGWANSFYSAAAQAGSTSWKAMLFGSSDGASFITVDKAPASLWVMDLSVRVFGLNAWGILVPEALEGVAAVGVLYATVRRWFSPGAGLIAGATLALTPVAALIFRFNNPDALLVLLLVGAAAALVRALEGASTTWLVLCGALVGFGFLAKMLQTLLVVPGFALAYLVAAPTSLRRRVGQLLAAGAAMLAAAGWWVAAVQLTPASARPYIGGSQDNSLWNLIFGYNGFGRLTGNEAGSVGGAGPSGARWGATGWSRLFNSEMGAQASWLIPAAVVLLLAGLASTWRRPRTDRARAALIVWGGWLLVTAAVFSFGHGIIHPYYTVALAPAIGAVIGIGASMVWPRREELAARMVLGGALVATTVWSSTLLRRAPTWHPELTRLVVPAGVVVAIGLVVAPHLRGRVGAALAVAAVVVGLSGSAAYAVATAATTHSGAIPSAGPAGVGGFGPGPGGPGGGARPGGQPPGGAGGGPGGGAGGLLNGSNPDAQTVAQLKTDAGSFTWVAATVLSNQAAGYQLATGRPVMAIGGFNGTDPAPTLAQFESYVAAGRIHYFVAGGGGGGPGGGPFGQTSSSTVATDITSWVESHFRPVTVGGTTLYDLTAPVTGA